MTTPLTPETAPDFDAYATAAAGLLGLTLDPAWREPVLMNLRVLHQAAALLEGFPLPDKAEAAPVFEA